MSSRSDRRKVKMAATSRTQVTSSLMYRDCSAQCTIADDIILLDCFFHVAFATKLPERTTIAHPWLETRGIFARNYSIVSRFARTFTAVPFSHIPSKLDVYKVILLSLRFSAWYVTFLENTCHQFFFLVSFLIVFSSTTEKKSCSQFVRMRKLNSEICTDKLGWNSQSDPIDNKTTGKRLGYEHIPALVGEVSGDKSWPYVYAHAVCLERPNLAR